MICSELATKIFYFATCALNAGFEQATVYITYVFCDIIAIMQQSLTCSELLQKVLADTQVPEKF